AGVYHQAAAGVLRDRLRRIPGPREIAAVERGEGALRKVPSERVRLHAPEIREPRVGRPLHAPLAIPLGFAVAYHYYGGLIHRPILAPFPGGAAVDPPSIHRCLSRR